jgi:hypothetical protein
MGRQHEIGTTLTATYQTLELACLNDALKQCGVAGTDLRRKVSDSRWKFVLHCARIEYVFQSPWPRLPTW